MDKRRAFANPQITITLFSQTGQVWVRVTWSTGYIPTGSDTSMLTTVSVPGERREIHLNSANTKMSAGDVITIRLTCAHNSLSGRYTCRPQCDSQTLWQGFAPRYRPLKKLPPKSALSTGKTSSEHSQPSVDLLPFWLASKIRHQQNRY